MLDWRREGEKERDNDSELNCVQFAVTLDTTLEIDTQDREGSLPD